MINQKFSQVPEENCRSVSKAVPGSMEGYIRHSSLRNSCSFSDRLGSGHRPHYVLFRPSKLSVITATLIAPKRCPGVIADHRRVEEWKVGVPFQPMICLSCQAGNVTIDGSMSLGMRLFDRATSGVMSALWFYLLVPTRPVLLTIFARGHRVLPEGSGSVDSLPKKRYPPYFLGKD